jgi:hypothetical protein
VLISLSTQPKEEEDVTRKRGGLLQRREEETSVYPLLSLPLPQRYHTHTHTERKKEREREISREFKRRVVTITHWDTVVLSLDYESSMDTLTKERRRE